MKEYRNFREFYDYGNTLASEICKSGYSLSDIQKVMKARQKYDKTILNSFIVIGLMSDNIKELLTCKNNILKFSLDNLIKNIINHPEISFEDYKKISSIAKFPSKFFKSKNGFDVILFKIDKICYKLVIKTTKNKEENFVKSLHLLNIERYNKY